MPCWLLVTSWPGFPAEYVSVTFCENFIEKSFTLVSCQNTPTVLFLQKASIHEVLRTAGGERVCFFKNFCKIHLGQHKYESHPVLSFHYNNKRAHTLLWMIQDSLNGVASPNGTHWTAQFTLASCTQVKTNNCTRSLPPRCTKRKLLATFSKI